MLNIDLTGRRALVTGSSSGLGEAMAHALAQAGAQVAVHDRIKSEACENVAVALRNAGSQAQAFSADISRHEEVAQLFSDIDAWCGGVDILINNAGMDGVRDECVDSNPADWEKTIAVNLLGPYYCSRLALKNMLQQRRGVILNITSVHEYIPWEGYSAYTSAKAGLSMFTKTLAQEVADKGVRVLALAPGAIRTPINAWVSRKKSAALQPSLLATWLAISLAPASRRTAAC
jgi:glucose 1-dehydrogenase